MIILLLKNPWPTGGIPRLSMTIVIFQDFLGCAGTLLHTEIHLLSKYVADLFRVAVDSVEEKWEAEAENSTSEESRENSHLLPTNLNPRIYKEANCKHDECNETYNSTHGSNHQWQVSDRSAAGVCLTGQPSVTSLWQEWQ